MTTYLILGAGKMGALIATDLANNAENVFIVDKHFENAKRLADAIGAKAEARDAVFDPVQGASAEFRALMEKSDVLVSAAHYALNTALTKLAIETKTHMVDLGGNPEVVQHQHALGADAATAGVSIMPDCGLAPGMANIVAAEGIRQLDRADEAHMRVGGLPEEPEGPLQYMTVFSVSGLINEYKERADVLRDGEKREVPSLQDRETLRMTGYDSLEAFTTAGGTGTMCDTFAGKVKTLDYKTIRYPGHCEKMRLLFALGFFEEKEVAEGLTRRDVNEEALEEALPKGGPDIVLMRVDVKGEKDGKPAHLSYELVDTHDGTWTAMQRTTGYSASAVAQLIAAGVIKERGVLKNEVHVPYDPYMRKLRERGVVIARK